MGDRTLKGDQPGHHLLLAVGARNAVILFDLGLESGEDDDRCCSWSFRPVVALKAHDIGVGRQVCALNVTDAKVMIYALVGANEAVPLFF